MREDEAEKMIVKWATEAAPRAIRTILPNELANKMNWNVCREEGVVWTVIMTCKQARAEKSHAFIMEKLTSRSWVLWALAWGDVELIVRARRRDG